MYQIPPKKYIYIGMTVIAHAHVNNRTMDSKRKRGRPKSLTDSARQMRKTEATKHYAKTRVHLGEYLDEWNDLRESLGLNSNPELAGFLLSYQ